MPDTDVPRLQAQVAERLRDAVAAAPSEYRFLVRKHR